MKFALRGVRTDFPPEIVKGKTREAFIAQWSKSVWQKAPVDVREQMLGEVWDILSEGNTLLEGNKDVESSWEGQLNPNEEIVDGLKEAFSTKPTRKTGKKNGVQADTKEPEAVRPDEGNGGDNQQ